MIVVREISFNDKESWDREIQRFEYAHPFNAFGWGTVRAIDGWHPTYIVVEREGVISGAALILEKRIPLLPYSILYSPKGPIWDYQDRDVMGSLVEKVKEIGKRRKAIFIRMDPNTPLSSGQRVHETLSALGFVHLDQQWTYWNAPCGTYRLDLRNARNEDELFQMIDAKARTGIRKAQKDGVTVRCADSKEDVTLFFMHFRAFADKKGFMTRGVQYMECLWNEYISQGKGKLFMAMYQGKLIGGEVCLYYGRFCAEMHRAVSYEFHKLRVNELLVWEGIKAAAKNNCTTYSLRGAGPTPAHDQFKQKFASLVSLVGYYDYPFNPVVYKAFCFLEFTVLPLAWPVLVHMRRVYNVLRKHLGRSRIS